MFMICNLFFKVKTETKMGVGLSIKHRTLCYVNPFYAEFNMPHLLAMMKGLRCLPHNQVFL